MPKGEVCKFLLKNQQVCQNIQDIWVLFGSATLQTTPILASVRSLNFLGI